MHLGRRQVAGFFGGGRFRDRPAHDLFISYRFRDSVAYAENLAHRLSSRGYSFFLDVDQIPSSEDDRTVAAYLARGLQTAGSLILLYSDHAFESEWVTWEVCRMARFKRAIYIIRSTAIKAESKDAGTKQVVQHLRNCATIWEEEDALKLGRPSSMSIDAIEKCCDSIRRFTRLLPKAIPRQQIDTKHNFIESLRTSPALAGSKPLETPALCRREYTIRQWIDLHQAGMFDS